MTDTFYIGLMSGTSLDGIDAVIVDLDNKPPRLVATHSHPIPDTLRLRIQQTIQPAWTGSLIQIGVLHQQLGKLFAEAVNHLLNKSDIRKEQVKAIGSHGQTVWHQPTGDHPFSLQLGDANRITELTQITTVADFRNRDIAAGGQGAPLVPAFHKSVLSHPDKNRIILNIGGIANISFLPSSSSDKNISGFDTGPGNALIDAWIFKHKKLGYDKDGSWANSGTVLSEVLRLLLDDPYFLLPPPKSTGKEFFNLEWLANKLGGQLLKHKAEDIQATLTELTAKTIANNINSDCDEIFICGGGIHNKYLINRLQKMLPAIPLKSTQQLGIDPDWMEAIAFAWLAKQTLQGKPGNLPEATGAKGFRILGAIYPV